MKITKIASIRDTALINNHECLIFETKPNICDYYISAVSRIEAVFFGRFSWIPGRRAAGASERNEMK